MAVKEEDTASEEDGTGKISVGRGRGRARGRGIENEEVKPGEAIPSVLISSPDQHLDDNNNVLHDDEREQPVTRHKCFAANQRDRTKR